MKRAVEYAQREAFIRRLLFYVLCQGVARGRLIEWPRVQHVQQNQSRGIGLRRVANISKDIRWTLVIRCWRQVRVDDRVLFEVVDLLRRSIFEDAKVFRLQARDW